MASRDPSTRDARAARVAGASTWISSVANQPAM